MTADPQQLGSDDGRMRSQLRLVRSPLEPEGPISPVPVRSDDARIRRLEARIRAQLESLLAHDPGVRLGRDPENLHQLRVAGRRLRTFLAVGRGLVDADWARELKAPLRQLGRASGA